MWSDSPSGWTTATTATEPITYASIVAAVDSFSTMVERHRQAMTDLLSRSFGVPRHILRGKPVPVPHPDQAGFLSAIIAAPDDDLPRLTYADWLDEHGEPERAEFIRVQCEAYQLASAPGFFDDLRQQKHSLTCQCPYHASVQRGSNLLKHHGILWSRHFWSAILPELNDEIKSHCTLGNWSWVFSRGFLSHLHIEWQTWNELGSQILAACPIRNAKDGLVRLTTFPEWGDRVFRTEYFAGTRALPFTQQRQLILGRTYPGIRFELPSDFHRGAMADLTALHRATDRFGTDGEPRGILLNVSEAMDSTATPPPESPAPPTPTRRARRSARTAPTRAASGADPSPASASPP